MAAGRPLLALISLILLAGGIVLQFFVILSGATYGTPENLVYFLRADTSTITGAPAESAWNFLALCGYGTNVQSCKGTQAALPFQPDQNFGTTTGVPPQFLGNNHFFYLSRFMFAFYIIALFFSLVAFFTGLVALCSRLGGYTSGLMTFLAWFFQALAASLMTAWTVQGRNAFNSIGHIAHLGAYAYGFTWASVVCFFISMILFCLAGSVGRKDKAYATTEKKRGGMFGRSKRSSRSRGSFVDGESGRRMVVDPV